MGGSSRASGSSQIACTSLTRPAGSPARWVSSTVSRLQASRTAASSRSAPRNLVAAAHMPIATRSAAITAVMKASNQAGSSQARH